MITAATVVQFIGLLITTVGGNNADIIMGKVDLSPPHSRIVAYEKSKLTSSQNWDKVGSFVRGGVTYDYVTVDVENITFSGSETPFDYSLVALPHLKCCCNTIARLKAAYADPTATDRRAAHIFISRGKYESVVQSDTSVITKLTLDDNPLTISGTPDKQIVLRSDARVIVAQAPLDSLKDVTSRQHAEVDGDHFLAYYQMVDSSTVCRLQPSDGAPCAPVTACGIVPKSKKAKPARYDVGDINCSSSQWP